LTNEPYRSIVKPLPTAPETNVFVKSSFLLSSALIAAEALAQAPLGTVTNVEGLVTVTDGATAGTVAPGQVISDGMRFVTTSGGRMTLQLNNGCTVTLQPGQAVTVLQRMTCGELVSAVQPVGGLSLAATGGGSLVKGLVAMGSLAAGGFVLSRTVFRSPSLSGL
jgi:hypothetical protein